MNKTDTHRAVLSYLLANAPCSYTELQEGCGLPGTASSDAFADLADYGVIAMVPYRAGEQQVWGWAEAGTALLVREWLEANPS